MEASILLVLTAAIWGFAFVAQRVGNQYVGPFTFTGIRFALGAVSLLPLIWISGRKKKKCDALMETTGITPPDRENAGGCLFIGKAGALTGSVLFFGAALQQVGLEDTTAGKAAFLTGFYIILVPLSGVFLKQKIGRRTWISVVFAIVGLYLISVNENTGISRGSAGTSGRFFLECTYPADIPFYAKDGHIEAVLCPISCLFCTQHGSGFADGGYPVSRHCRGRLSDIVRRDWVRGDCIYPAGLWTEIRKAFPCGDHHESGIGIRCPWRFPVSSRNHESPGLGRLCPHACRCNNFSNGKQAV